MDFKIVCGTWIKEDDERILTVLEKADRWLTAEELCKITGLPLKKVQSTLTKLNQQMKLAEARKNYFMEE